MKAPLPTFAILAIGIGTLWVAIRQAEKGECNWKGTIYKQSDNPLMFWLYIGFLTLLGSMGILMAIIFQTR